MSRHTIGDLTYSITEGEEGRWWVGSVDEHGEVWDTSDGTVSFVSEAEAEAGMREYAAMVRERDGKKGDAEEAD